MKLSATLIERAAPGALRVAANTVVALLSGVAVSAPVPNVAPGHWMELPDTRLDAHAPEPLPPGVEGVSAVMDDWSGGVLDTRENRLVVWGGGHAGYAGNELYAFDLDELSWSRIWGPTPTTQIPATGTVETYDDGNPGTRHTYDNIVYDPVRHALWSAGGSLWKSGGASTASWCFDLAQGRWVRLADAPAHAIYTQSAWDPVQKKIVYRNNKGIFDYLPADDRWQRRAEGKWGHWDMNGELDPQRRELVMAGGGRFETYHVDRGIFAEPETGGDAAVVAARAPGLAYHPGNGQIVAWAGGAAVHVLQVSGERYIWQRIPAAPDNAVTPSSPNVNGTYGRFRYVPALDLFVLVNRTDENVYLYRLPE